MRLSVVVGTLNVGGKKIERLIKSFIDQEYLDKELIIIDGCSTDDTLEVLQKYSKFIDYWVSEPDNGLIDAYNKGVKMSTGDYICFMGGSDWFNTGVFSEVRKTYDKTKADVLYGDCCIEQQDGIFITRSAENVDLNSLYYSSSAFCTAGTFAKRDIFSLIEEIDLKIANDVYLWGMSYRKGYKFEYVNCGRPIAFFSYGGVSTIKEYPLWKDVRKARLMVIEGSDELSKRWKHLLDAEYGLQMCGLYRKIILAQDFARVLSDCLPECLEYVIWGCGKYGQDIAMDLEKERRRVKYFVDNNENRVGNLVLGLRVEAPNRLLSEKNMLIIISASKYELEIKKQIEGMKLDSSVQIDSVGNIYYKIYQILGDDILDRAYAEGIIR